MSNRNAKHTPGLGGMRIFRLHYIVSVTGNVYSQTGWRAHVTRPMTQFMGEDGYRYVRLTVNSVRTKHRVHKLVCELFHGLKPSTKHEVCHIDGNPLNNHASNLRWGTRKENAADREKHGRTSRGLKHSTAIKRGIYNGKSK